MGLESTYNPGVDLVSLVILHPLMVLQEVQDGSRVMRRMLRLDVEESGRRVHSADFLQISSAFTTGFGGLRIRSCRLRTLRWSARDKAAVRGSLKFPCELDNCCAAQKYQYKPDNLAPDTAHSSIRGMSPSLTWLETLRVTARFSILAFDLGLSIPRLRRPAAAWVLPLEIWILHCHKAATVLAATTSAPRPSGRAPATRLCLWSRCVRWSSSECDFEDGRSNPSKQRNSKLTVSGSAQRRTVGNGIKSPN